MKILRASALAGLALLAVSAGATAASAAAAYTTTTVNQRQGPSTSYDVVTSIPGGSTVVINGCLSGAAWCDVTWGGSRGWVVGKYLEGTYQSRRVGVPYYVPQLGFPIVTFSFGSGGYHHRGNHYVPPHNYNPPHKYHRPHHKPPHNYKPPHHYNNTGLKNGQPLGGANLKRIPANSIGHNGNCTTPDGKNIC